MLEHKREANLSVVRFRQVRGAASSLGKVVDSLGVAMGQRELLVQDPGKAKKMASVFDDFAD